MALRPATWIKFGRGDTINEAEARELCDHWLVGWDAAEAAATSAEPAADPPFRFRMADDGPQGLALRAEYRAALERIDPVNAMAIMREYRSYREGFGRAADRKGYGRGLEGRE